MEHVVKRFTIIDFLGIFLPGAIFVLILQLCFGCITTPCEKFFGKNDVALSVYFLFLSYLTGIYLHYLGSRMEAFFWKRGLHYDSASHKKYWDNPKVREAYTKKIDPVLPNTDDQKADAARQILHYIQRTQRPERIVLFSAFYAMNRTMVITLLLSAAVIVCFDRRSADEKFIIALCLTALLVLSVRQWWEYDERCMEEAYLIFAAE